MTKTAFTPTTNQLAIMRALASNDGMSAQDVARAKGVTVGATSVYNTLRALKGRQLVLERRTQKGTTPKGDRYEYRIAAKGRRVLEKLT